MSVINMLESKITVLQDKSSSWIQYVRDYKTILRDNGTTKTISSADRIACDYKLEQLLYRNKISQDISWIVRIVNNMSSNMDLTDIDEIIIPDISYIRNLYVQYGTIQKIEQSE